MMQFREEITYPSPPDAVFAMLTDPEFRSLVCRETGALSHSVAVEPSGVDIVVSTVRVMPAQVPEFVRRFVGEHIEVAQHERWPPAEAAGHRSAALSLQITGAPATMRGGIHLVRTADGGCLETISGDLRVQVPFVGGRIEPEVARALRLAIGKEAEVGHGYLTTPN